MEHIVNENNQAARALLHNVIVEKSRKIYEELGLDDDQDGLHKPDDILDEIDVEENEPNTFESDEDGEFEGDEEFGGDEADDLTADTFADEDGDTEDEFSDDEGTDDGYDSFDHEGGEDEIEDRVVGLEDALDDLKAEFEQYVQGSEDHEEEEADDEEESAEDDHEQTDFDDEVADDTEEDFEEDGETEDEVEESVVREYVEKVTAKAGTTEASGTNTKSVVAGKNDMGGSAKNLNQGSSEEKGRPTPTSKPISSEKFQNAPGGKKTLKPAPKPDKTKEDGGTNKKSPY